MTPLQLALLRYRSHRSPTVVIVPHCASTVVRVVFAIVIVEQNLTNLLCSSFDSNNVPVVNSSMCDSFLSSTKFTTDNVKRYALVYHLFGLLWTNQFIDALGIMVVSGAISRWYFTMDKKTGLARFPCCGSCRRACR